MLLSVIEKRLKQYHADKGWGRKWLPTFFWGNRPDVELLETFVAVMRAEYPHVDVDISFEHFFNYLRKINSHAEDKTYLLFNVLNITEFSQTKNLSLSEQLFFLPWCNELAARDREKLRNDARDTYYQKYPPSSYRSEGFSGLMGGV